MIPVMQMSHQQTGELISMNAFRGNKSLARAGKRFSLHDNNRGRLTPALRQEGPDKTHDNNVGAQGCRRGQCRRRAAAGEGVGHA